MAGIARLARGVPHVLRPPSGAAGAALAAALLLAALIWAAPSELATDGRVALTTFLAAIWLWVFTGADDTLVAVAAALVLAVSGALSPGELAGSAADPTILLLLGAFVIAAAAAGSGLAGRLTATVASHAASVSGLFYLLTGALMATAFVIPSTSGRAALAVPVFAGLATAIDDRRVVRALALLFPAIILLSAIASLIGAGAHLVTAEILSRTGAAELDFARWMLLGLPFALVSCFVTTWVILHLFLRGEERRRPLRFDPDGGGPLSRDEWVVLAVVGALIALWCSEPLHGLDNTLVALLGALALTLPRVGVAGLGESLGEVDWNLLVFLAATLVLGGALIDSGAARWLADGLLGVLSGPLGDAPFVVVAIVAAVSLLSHLVINSRTARASVLIPLVVLVATSLGHDPAALAFVSTAAAGFCLTLTVSAKPVLMFSRLDRPTYEPRDLLRLSRVLLPLHLALLLAFAFLVWPLLGLAP
jgi:sodium-dependent dicarboxylate transporter 2/3/5